MPERVRCPVCRKESPWRGNPYRPFCSERCRLIDLGNWLGERYRISAPASDDESPEPSEAEDEE